MNFKSRLVARLLDENTSDQTAEEKVLFLTKVLMTVASEADDTQLSMIASIIAQDEFIKCDVCEKFSPRSQDCQKCGSIFCEGCAEFGLISGTKPCKKSPCAN